MLFLGGFSALEGGKNAFFEPIFCGQAALPSVHLPFKSSFQCHSLFNDNVVSKGAKNAKKTVLSVFRPVFGNFLRVSYF